MIVEQPGEVTPFFVHGPTGVGKTHLLEGIWSEMRRRGGRRVIYLAAEQFTTYFLQALRGSGLPSFRQKYREVDLLIIDDVQFFAGKQATIIELLHTIDALLRESRQLVLAADRPLQELRGLGNEFAARTAGGLACGMQPLDFETRREVLRQSRCAARILGRSQPYWTASPDMHPAMVGNWPAPSTVCGLPVCHGAKLPRSAWRSRPSRSCFRSRVPWFDWMIFNALFVMNLASSPRRCVRIVEFVRSAIRGCWRCGWRENILARR